jgi:hypothetical protein
MLIWYSLRRNQSKECPAGIIASVENAKLIPVVLGVVNSLGLCPALLIMLTKSSTEDTLVKSWLAFLAFFAGSSLWFFPLPLAGIIFIIKGLTILIGGIING